MTKHSKNNTASSIFSYAEYKKLDAYYGTKKQRLGNESMRPFDSCSLCLQRAREPLACNKGHLFCKECVYSDLLAQKKDMKRMKEKMEVMHREEEEQRNEAREKARERVLKEFETGLLGVGLKRKAIDLGPSSSEQARNVRPKFDLDQDKLDALAKEAEDVALKQIELEQAEARKAKLPDFWLPSLTPQAAAGRIKDIKLHTMCHSSSPAHQLNLKSLIPVSFHIQPNSHGSSANDDTRAMCPSCKKTLSNNIIIFLMKPCSHVICRTCVDELVKPSHQCVFCDKTLQDQDIIELKREGTGFASAGIAETSKAGVSFQG